MTGVSAGVSCSVQRPPHGSGPLLGRRHHGRLCVRGLPRLPVSHRTSALIVFFKKKKLLNKSFILISRPPPPSLQASPGVPPCSEATVGQHLLPWGRGSRGASEGEAFPPQGGEPSPADRETPPVGSPEKPPLQQLRPFDNTNGMKDKLIKIEITKSVGFFSND